MIPAARISGGGGSRGANGCRRRSRAAVLAVGLSVLMTGAAAQAADGNRVDPATPPGRVFSGHPTQVEPGRHGAAFRSRLAPAAAAAVVFAAIGDYGDGSTASGDVANLVDGWTPSFIIAAGDNRYGASTFDDVVGRFYCGHLTDAKAGPWCSGGTSPANDFFPAPGNHDYNDGGGLAEYLDYFTLPGAGVAGSGTSGNERYYDFVRGPVHFFALDSQAALTDPADMAAQKAWLQAQLAASTSAWKIVFFHHPPYSSGTHGSSPAMQWPFAAWGADAVIAGHDHTYERIDVGGIPYFVNGLGGRSIYSFGTPVPGSQLRYNDDYGAMRISADGAQMTFEFVNLAGAVVDSFTTNGDPIPPPPSATLDYRIASGADDVEESLGTGFMYIDSSDIELGEDPGFNGAQTVGLRFQNLYVPQGATINAAYLVFTVDETNSVDATDVVIRAQAADDAPAFSSTAHDLTDRALTVASVPWSIPAWNAVGATQQSPDLSAVLQEIVDRGGWSPYNSVAFVIGGTGHRTAESYEGAPSSGALLHVEYTTEAAPGQAPTPQGALSRKVHGAAGTFDLPLSLQVGSPQTEPRSAGAGGAHTIVVTFDKPISGATATVTEGAAAAGSPSFNGNEVTVGLTGVGNAQYVTISLTDVTSTDGGTGGGAAVRVGFLAGDANQNRAVTLSDLLGVNAVLTQTLSAANYLRDVNVSGSLSVADLQFVNSRLTQVLPVP